MRFGKGKSNFVLPDTGNYQIGKYGRMAVIVAAMDKQEDVTEAPKATDQMEWVRRINSIRNRTEEIILTEFVYA